MVEKKQKTIQFIHQFSDDYRIVPANGAFGGISARGDLIMHFFLEHSKVPHEEINISKPDGSLEISREETNEVEVIRDASWSGDNSRTSSLSRRVVASSS